MITLEETIQYCVDVSKNEDQPLEHRELANQIAKWLGELKEMKEGLA